MITFKEIFGDAFWKWAKNILLGETAKKYFAKLAAAATFGGWVQIVLEAGFATVVIVKTFNLVMSKVKTDAQAALTTERYSLVQHLL